MKILLINTVFDRLEIGILLDNEVIVDLPSAEKHSHSAEVNPAIQRVMDRAKLTFNELDAYAVCIGPGSFTGIRVGIATVKAFCAVHKKPLIAINSLDLIAFGKTPCLAVLDAGRGRVYACEYTTLQTENTAPQNSNAALYDSNVALQDTNTTVQDLNTTFQAEFDVPKANGEPKLIENPQSEFITVEYDSVDYIDRMAKIAIHKFNVGEFVSELHPLYLQLCQAEESLLNKTAQANKSKE